MGRFGSDHHRRMLRDWPGPYCGVVTPVRRCSMNLPITMSGVVLTATEALKSWNIAPTCRCPRLGQVKYWFACWLPGSTILISTHGSAGMTARVTGRYRQWRRGRNGGLERRNRLPRAFQGGDLCGRVIALGDDVAPEWEGKRIVVQNCQPIPTAANPVALRVIGSDYDGGVRRILHGARQSVVRRNRRDPFRHRTCRCPAPSALPRGCWLVQASIRATEF